MLPVSFLDRPPLLPVTRHEERDDGDQDGGARRYYRGGRCRVERREHAPRDESQPDDEDKREREGNERVERSDGLVLRHAIIVRTREDVDEFSITAYQRYWNGSEQLAAS